MAGLFDILNIGGSALNAAQAGVHTTGQNIANVNTPGYHRRELVQAAADPIDYRGFTLGSGVQVFASKRIIDRALDNRHRDAGSDAAEAQARSESLVRAEAVFSDMQQGGISVALDELFAAFDYLAAEPQNDTARTNLLGRAASFAAEVRNTAAGLHDTQSSLNESIESQVQQVNRLTSEIAGLNKNIAQQADPPAELLDKRDALIEQLSGIVGARAVENDNNTIDLYTRSGCALVIGDRSHPLAAQMGVNGLVQIASSDGTVTRDLTGRLAGGSLSGFLQARDGDIQAVIDTLDKFAFDFANLVNSVHTAGFGLDGLSGRNLFVPPGAVQDAATSLQLDPTVAADPGLIAAAADPAFLPGDNSNALDLAALRDDVSMNGITPAENLRRMLADLGDRSRDAANTAEYTGVAADQLYELQQSISGVSLDEEMIALLKFRQAYDAATKVVQTADELVSEILAIKR